MFASLIIGWGAEVLAIHISVGIALAILAWLQTAPEFAVEAVIAWSRDSNLVLANFTGSLRLLMGLGWPMVFFIYWYTSKRRGTKVNHVQLQKNFAVETAGLFLSVLYFTVVWATGAWSAIDGMILCGLYLVYLWLLNRQRKAGIENPHESTEDEGWVVRKITSLSKKKQFLAAIGIFVVGGGILLLTVHPFLDALKGCAVYLGVSEFVFIQWIAPIASEFPEKVTAFNWARKPKKVPLAIINMLSSIVSQWTLLAGLVPIIYSISAGQMSTIILTDFQKTEVLLTITQSALAVVFLLDLKITALEMAGLFILWAIQFLMPSSRELLIYVYGVWIVGEFIRLSLKPAQLLVPKVVASLFLKKQPAAAS